MTTAKEKAAAVAAKAAEALADGKPTSEQIAALNEQTITHPDQVKSAHGEIAKPSSGGGKVFVGCKVGVAHIDLQLSKLIDKEEQTQSGLRPVKVPERYGPVVRIRGTAYPRGQVPEGFPDRPDVVAGCTLNPGVDRDFMIEWLRLNNLSPLVMNNMIFIEETRESAAGKARELAGVTSGFEPMNPKKDARTPKPTNPGVGDLNTEDERAKKMERAQPQP